MKFSRICCCLLGANGTALAERRIAAHGHGKAGIPDRHQPRTAHPHHRHLRRGGSDPARGRGQMRCRRLPRHLAVHRRGVHAIGGVCQRPALPRPHRTVR